MTPDEIRDLAIECGAWHLSQAYSFNDEELAAYTAAVESPLQTRIDELETVPMKYLRMEFNAQLQNELAAANAHIARLEIENRIMREGLEVVSSKTQTDKLLWWQVEARKVLSLAESPDTWLSEHDKKVEAKERERCAAICDARSKLCATKADLTDDEYDQTDLKSQAWQFSVLADEIRELK